MASVGTLAFKLSLDCRDHSPARMIKLRACQGMWNFSLVKRCICSADFDSDTGCPLLIMCEPDGGICPITQLVNNLISAWKYILNEYWMIATGLASFQPFYTINPPVQYLKHVTLSVWQIVELNIARHHQERYQRNGGLRVCAKRHIR